MITIREKSRRDRLRLGEQVELLAMSRSSRRKFLAQMGGKVQKQTKANINSQQTVDGSPMTPRISRQWNKRKMLMGMRKGMRTWVNPDTEANVTWKSAAQAKVAYAQHHGLSAMVTPKAKSKGKGKKASKGNGGKATRKQANALLNIGFKRRVPRKRGKGGALLKRVSRSWIMRNISEAQAGVILREMGYKSQKRKKFWLEAPSPRPFHGVKAGTEKQYLTELASSVLKDVKRG